jgi:3-methyladenine DNA glycosylase/8-oxoguanine DNA glycosylase
VSGRPSAQSSSAAVRRELARGVGERNRRISQRPLNTITVWRLPGFGALVFARLTALGGRVPDSGELAATDRETLRALGLSWRMAETVLDLARRFSEGRLSEAKLRELHDEAVIGQLTEVKGIGAWTVQGALLIALRRPDVVRPGDLALRQRAARARLSPGGSVRPDGS